MGIRSLLAVVRVTVVAFVVTAATTRREGARAAPPDPSLPSSTLSVWRGSEWREWWRSDAAPARWRGPASVVAGAIRWRRAADGVEWGELRLAGVGEARRLRAIVVRLDPRRVRLRLDTSFVAGSGAAAWTIDTARPDAIVAVNVGQFIRTLPWGWVVLDGREFLAPGRGPLSTAVAIDSNGAVRWIPANALGGADPPRGIVAAFQSYPTLLVDGDIPAPLQARGRGVDLDHRDARLGLGALQDGRLLIVLTRFDAAGASLGALPFGPTIPEFAALMGALGARSAVALDGGISGQLLVREGAGELRRWRGMRRVPLGLVALPR